MCVRSSRFCGIFAALAITFALCLGGVEASAENEMQYTRQSARDMHEFYGNTLSCNYTYNGAPYSADLVFCGSVCSSGTYGQVSSTWSGCMIDSDNFFYTSYRDFDVIFYYVNVGNSGVSLYDISVFGLDTYYSEYARGAILGEFYDINSYLTNDLNSITLHPNNYFGSNYAICAPYQVSANLSDYYGWCSVVWNNDITIPFRVIPYEFTNGGQIGTVHFDSLRSDRYGNLIIGVVCPYTGGSISASSPAETTSTGNSGGQTIINNNVDLTETHSILGGIANFLSDIWEAIRGVPGSILSGIQAIFVPEDGYFDSKVAQVKAKFSWYEDIVDAWTEFKTALNGISADTPPSITLSLDNRTFFGRPIGSGSGTALVLDWMFTYRNTIRNLLSAFMWIFFIWRLYCHIPNIISGSGMEVQKTDEGAAWTIHGHKL